MRELSSKTFPVYTLQFARSVHIMVMDKVGYYSFHDFCKKIGIDNEWQS